MTTTWQLLLKWKWRGFSVTFTVGLKMTT